MTELIFLSHIDRATAQELADMIAEKTGAEVVTNHTYLGENDPDKRADWRMSKIDDASVFVFFASPPGTPQLVRSIELGFAIGAGVPVVFIGHPRNSYHRFGEVFADTDRFLAAWATSKAAQPS